MLKRRAAWLLAGALALSHATAATLDTVTLPATTRRPALTLHWAPLDAQRHPVVVALHGCGGLYKRDGRTLEARYPSYVEHLHALGFHVLLPDSFSSRGLTSVCSQRYGTRNVSIADRRADVLDALAWLRARPDVDADRIALLGWSNGATTALSTMDTRQTPPVPPLAAVVLFYPGCGRQQAAEPAARAVLVQLGASDDWTAPEPCARLARRWQAEGRDVTLDVYAGAYHGFDTDAPVRFRADVPNGRNAAGVHLGGNPEAYRASQARLAEFLTRQLDPDGQSRP
ncbi:dienelactone hydrolase family protein [Roseateles sp. BYS78W]|uniref:Dienelactone hydrolase family protein n=1 Tax=Pelomonas candidula TaxID=3299025 RepID=A0ABW7H9Y5_9BURK